MSRKKHAAEHVNHERWLVSYADFITLLFAFFVVLFASSQVDRSKTKKMALAINSAFETFSIFKDQSGDPLSSEGGGAGGNARKFREMLVESDSSKSIIMPPELASDEVQDKAPTGDESLNQNTGMITSQEEALARVHRTLMDLIKKKKLSSEVEIQQNLRGLVISVKDSIMFEAGVDKISQKSEDVLKILGPVLASFPNQVRIEGHTDNKKVAGAYKSNWELSTARASFIIGWLVQHYNLLPERFIAVGYGPYRPIASNDTEEGRLKNRRVDIILLTDDLAQKEAALPKSIGLFDSSVEKVIPGNRDINMPNFKSNTSKSKSRKSENEKLQQIRKILSRSTD